MDKSILRIIAVLKEAIDNYNTVHFLYKGKKRTVNPHLIGINGGKLQLHAFQIAGGSKNAKLPNWRNFDIEEISEFNNNKLTFSPPSPGYNPAGTPYTEIIFQINVPKHKN